MSSSFLKSFLVHHGLSYIAQVYKTGITVADHFESFKQLIEMSLHLDPIPINSQTGADRWPLDEKKEFLALALDFQKHIPVPIMYETHRDVSRIIPGKHMPYSGSLMCCISAAILATGFVPASVY